MDPVIVRAQDSADGKTFGELPVEEGSLGVKLRGRRFLRLTLGVNHHGQFTAGQLVYKPATAVDLPKAHAPYDAE